MKTYVHRLYTENKDAAKIEEIADSLLSGYTIYHTKGRFEGTSEYSLILEVIGSLHDGRPLLEAAQLVKQVNNQQEVWVTTQEIELTVI